jgi:hypothetical protein
MLVMLRVSLLDEESRAVLPIDLITRVLDRYGTVLSREDQTSVKVADPADRISDLSSELLDGSAKVAE